MTTDTTEKGLESLIVQSLVNEAGYVQGDPQDYDREHAVDLAKLLQFLAATQPDTYEALGIDEEGPKRTQFLHRLQGEIAKRGVVDCLRHGIKHGPAHVELFYGTPTPGNVKAAERFAANIFSVTRQLRYSRNETALSLDMAVFINGLPITTFELKNRLTKQTVLDAVQQYQRDRDPKELLFEGFILDVLKNYTPVESYYRLAKTVKDDPLFDANKAQKKLRRYVESHEHAIREKAEIMVDHFHAQVIGHRKIGGQARAMVITNGIERAIQYFHAFKDYLKERKNPYEPIVAFSGEHEYGGKKVTEATLNGFPRSQIPDKVQQDPYRFLIVADKYQTGYDEAFVRTYGFLASILPYSNGDWEKLSIFLNFLIPKLPAPKEEDLSRGILEAIDMDSYRVEVKTSLKIGLPDQDAEIGSVPTSGGGRKPEPELDQLSNIIKAFNDQFDNIDWKVGDKIRKVIAEEIPAKVAADAAYQNAMKNNDKKTARIEHDAALQRVMIDLLADHTELFKQFSDNPSFKKWLGDTIFGATYQQQAGQSTTGDAP
ncbi:MAG: type I restriction endonuclease [Desulfuromonadales bacterium]